MQLTLIQIIAMGAAILLLGVFAGRLMKKREGEGLFARIFKDNKDFDSTLDRLSITAIILFMLAAFHDDMADPVKAGLIINVFLMAFNAWQALVLGKAMKDINQSGGQK